MRLNLNIARALVLGASMSALAGCGGCSNTSTTAPPTWDTISGATSTVSTVSLYGDDAYYAAEAAYSGVQTTIQTWHDTGTLKGATATQVKTYLDQAYGFVKTARTARGVADTTAETVNALNALGLIGKIVALAPAGVTTPTTAAK